MLFRSHAIYGNFEGIIDIEKNEMIGGNLPPRIIGIIKEWTSLHQRELIENWERAREQELLKEIKPLI